MEAAERAGAVITVCQALKDRLCEIGAAPDRITVLRNGVDLQLFHPQDRDAPRLKYGVTGKVALSVGHLIARKAHDLVIRAVAGMPDVTLLIAGEGPERGALIALAASLGIAGRVRFLGQVAPGALAEIYAAADVLVLASSREGWANVLLEAMASGTPVVATNVNGTPEVIADPRLGVLVEERSAPALARAIRALREKAPDRAAVRAYAEQFSWDDTARANKALFLAAARYGYEDRFNPAIVTAAYDVLTKREFTPA